jgi:uncharacterized membrane protein
MENQVDRYPTPNENISPSGFPGLLVVFFVIFGIATFFRPEDNIFLFGTLASGGIILAVFMRLYFNRKSAKDREELFHAPTVQKTHREK